MASNSGTGLRIRQHKSHKTEPTQFSRLSRFTNLSREEWDISFSDMFIYHLSHHQCLQPWINKHSMQEPQFWGNNFRRELKSATPIESLDLRWIAYVKDTLATHESRISVKRWLTTQIVDWLTLKVDYFNDWRLYHARKHASNTSLTTSEVSAPEGYGSRPLYMQFPVFGMGEGERYVRGHELKVYKPQVH